MESLNGSLDTGLYKKLVSFVSACTSWAAIIKPSMQRRATFPGSPQHLFALEIAMLSSAVSSFSREADSTPLSNVDFRKLAIREAYENMDAIYSITTTWRYDEDPTVVVRELVLVKRSAVSETVVYHYVGWRESFLEFDRMPIIRRS
ncbi:hypothetical protein BJ742DRAFT_859699 [Cladochytrium replicatum]|nr:hypothetical protein BJ742DRAFT_859699 [Cladochytrium replicatum]